MRKLWYLMLLTLHELRCSDGLYQVYNDDDLAIVIHDPCGRVWSAHSTREALT